MPAIPEIIETNEVLVAAEANTQVIDDLLAVVGSDKTIFCGGIAIAHHLKQGYMAEPHQLAENDLDALVITINHILRPEILNAFDVRHIHDYSKKAEPYHNFSLPHDKFYVVLKHKKTGVTVDMFHDKPFDPIQLDKVKFGDLEILIRSAEDQSVTKLLETIRVMGSNLYELPKGPIIHPKQIPELLYLLTVCNPEVVQRIWATHPTRIAMGYPFDFYEALGDCVGYVARHPDMIPRTAPKSETGPQVVAGVEKKDCPECIFDYPGFPITKQG